MTRNCCRFSFGSIYVNGMATALAKFFAATAFKVSKQVTELYAALRRNGSLITSAPSIDSSAS